MLTPHRYCTIFLPSLALAACDPEPPIDNRPMPTLDLAECTQTWRTLFVPEESPYWAEGLRLQGDRLFFSWPGQRDAGVVSVPTTGGAATTTVRKDGQLRFWIEGEQLLFVRSDGLFRTPLAGGAVEQLLGGGPHFDRDNQTFFPTGWALDDDSLFWAENVPPNGPEKATIWRGLRNGGGETALATLTTNSLIDEILPVGDQLIVTANGGAAVWAVPRMGGTPRTLAWLTGGQTRLKGILDDGQVLFTKVGADDHPHPDSTIFVVGRARIDGAGFQTLWTTKSPIVPTAVWSDGAGRWYVSTIETATDLTAHAAIWSVDGAGKAIRLACDPKEGSTIESAVATGDAIYLLVEQHGGGTPSSLPPPATWQLATVKAPTVSP
jgi:hypothetical protein